MDTLFRQRADRLPAAIVLMLFSLQIAAVLLIDDVTTMCLVAAGLLLFSACPGAISHNHHHYPTFRRQWQNRIYEVMLFFLTGIPPFAWTLHHNLGHHKHYLAPELDPSAWQDKAGRVMPRIRYDLYNAARIYPEIIRIGRQRPKLLKRFYRWTAVSVALLGLLLWQAPAATLILVILPMPLMLIGLLDNTYQQHQGLDMRSDFTASRNTTSRLYNLVSWNLGYHTAHHCHPSVHWSKLPALHASLADRIPDELVCDSVLLSRCGKPDSRLIPALPYRQQPLSARAC